MKCSPLLLFFALVGACSGETVPEDSTTNGAAINRAEDAPGNNATAPVPVSGSGEVPPNARNTDDGNGSMPQADR